LTTTEFGELTFCDAILMKLHLHRVTAPTNFAGAAANFGMLGG
jgi:hypothetical protein